LRDAENLARPVAIAPTRSAMGMGSPVVFIALASKGCATSVLSRTKRRCPGGAKVTRDWAGASARVSFESREPIR
jgi:hypothetical protein